MEANTFSILSVFKWLCPSLVGSVLAVWYKRNEIDWKNKSKSDKWLLSFVALAAIIVGVVIGLTISNIIITYTNITEFWYQFGIHLISSLSSLKILDTIVKNTDDILTIVVDGIKTGVKKIVNKITGNNP